MTLYRAFTKWLKQRQEKILAGQALHRQIVVISLADLAPFIDKIAETFPTAHFITPHTATTSAHGKDLSQTKLNHVAAINYRSLLGTQAPCVIFDARNGLNLDALIASSGLITKSGVLFLLLPEYYRDSARYKNEGIAYSYSDASDSRNEKSLFLALLVSHLKECKVLWLDKHKSGEERQYSEEDFANYPTAASDSTLQVNSTAQNFTLSPQQNTILARIANVERVTDHSEDKEIHVILGNRGRGKSTLLAQICLKSPGSQTVFVSAPTKSQLVTFAHHVSEFTKTAGEPNSRTGNAAINNKHVASSIQLVSNKYRFVAPDQLLSTLTELNPNQLQNTLLLIDEVASIAPNLLKEILGKCAITVLAGTTQGYEGSGQGFVHRVLPYIKENYLCSIYELSTSFRWYPNDPIEHFFQELLGVADNTTAYSAITNELPLQSAQVVTRLSKQSIEKHENGPKINIQVVDKALLLSTPDLYQSVVSLLRDAHYQTTPNDVLRLLDAPDQVLIGAFDPTQSAHYICGLAVLINEGGSALKELSSEIAMGKRRVQGHLTPQALALHLLQGDICQYTCLRINRIAVRDDYRSQGIGSRIVKFCDEYAREHKINYMSTSFGFTPSLFNFWRHNAFEFIKLGSRTDTSSGTVSTLMLSNVCLPHWHSLSANLINRRHTDIAYLKAFYFKKSASTVIPQLEHIESISTPTDVILSDNVRRILLMFVESDIELDKVAAFVWSLINDGHYNMQLLVPPFIEYHAKGVHKSKRNFLQETIRVTIEASLKEKF